MLRLLAVLLCLSLAQCQYPMQSRRLRMVVTVDHQHQLPPYVELFKKYNASLNIASSYCYDIPHVTKNLSNYLGNRTCFCEKDFTAPLRKALPKMNIQPVIQLGGDSANFKMGTVFGQAMLKEAKRYGYNGYWMDVEFHGSPTLEHEYAAFLENAKKVLNPGGVALSVLWHDNHFKPMERINSSVNCVEPETDGEHGCDPVIKTVRVMGYRFRDHGGVCLYPKPGTDSGGCAEKIFTAMNAPAHNFTRLSELAFYGNFHYLGDSWYKAMKNWLAGAKDNFLGDHPELHKQ